MSAASKKKITLAATGAVVAALTTTSAMAGGFAVREQSAEFQGMSFAGNAASGGGLSGMFWNPAIAAYAPVGLYTESHYAAILGNVEITAGPGSTLLVNGASSGNIAEPALVPSSYMSYRASDNLVFAVSVNSPFGLVTEPNNRFWAGMTQARTSEIKTYNVAPTIGYRLFPTLSIGVGLQIEHIEARLKSASGVLPTSRNLLVQGDDTAFGFTAGLNWTPTQRTAIGLGYRSSIDHTLEGSISIPGSLVPPAAQGASVRAGVTLPEIVTLSLRHGLSDKLTMLASVEWSHWNRAQSLDITCANMGVVGNPVFCPAGNGQLVRSLALGWHDSWMFSLGAEYQHSPALKLRAGLAYELSPIQNPDERSLRVPDVDRLWTSIGATYKWNEKMSFDLAYTHIFGVGDGAIDRTESGIRFVGTTDSQVDIVSMSFKYKFGDVASYEPLK